MRQAIIMGITALLIASVLPRYLLPANIGSDETLVLIIEEEHENKSVQEVVLKTGQKYINLPLEEYLIGVVLSEMPASFEIEALKAQAVAARTVTYRRLIDGKHDDCDLCSESNCCQAWNSQTKLEEKLGDSYLQYWERAKKAVSETAGEALHYENTLIDAVYFSCSGGKTEAAVAVWGNEVPYLQSVISTGEEHARVYETEVSIPVDKFKSMIINHNPTSNLSGDPGTWIGSITRTAGDGVDTVLIGGIIVEGTTLRSLFKLNSTNFKIVIYDDCVKFLVKGYGHRVGLSQYGANAMAKEGRTYREILSHYYRGTELKQIK